MKSLLLHFIRHGETAANTEGRYIGTTDLALTMESADELEKLSSEGIYPISQQLYSSPLRRCLQTGILIYPEQNAIPVVNLAEYNFGDFEGKSGLELEGNQEYADWISGKLPAPPNGESTKDFTVRICTGLRQIVEDMLTHNISSASVITHGGVIMSIFDACALPRKRKFEWVCDAGHGYTVRITPSLYQSSGVIEVIDAF